MKKLIHKVGLMLLCATPLLAEDYPIDMMLKDMGYLSPEISVNVANEIKTNNTKAKVFNADKKKAKEKKVTKSTVISKVIIAKDDVLYPRITDVNESPEMIPALLRYHKANPKSEKITKKIAVSTFSIGQYKEALYWYTLTYQRNRNDLESLWNMATIANSLGEKRNAKIYFTEYLKADPASVWGKKARCILQSGCLDQDDSEYFDKEISKILEHNPVCSESEIEYNSDSSKNNKGNMMLVSANEKDLETFVASYKSKANFYDNATKDGDTLKGKSHSKLEKKEEKVGSKTLLEKIAEANESQKPLKISSNAKMEDEPTANINSIEEDDTVKIVAAPLGK